MGVRLGVAVVLAGLACAGSAAAADWLKITTPDGAFSFETPNPPSIDVTKGTASNHIDTLYTFTASVGDFEIIALAETFDSPLISVAPETLAAKLLANFKGKAAVSESRPVQRGPNDLVPGHFIEGSSANRSCQIRVASDGASAFMLMACSPSIETNAAEKDKAIAAFTLAKPHSSDNWQAITSGFDAMRFKAPPGPKITNQDNGGVPQTVLYARDGGLFVLATYADAGDVDPAGLDNLVEGYVSGGKYKLLAKTAAPFTVKGRIIPGYLLDTANKEMRCKTRLLADGAKTYALGACTMKGYQTGDLADQVLASLDFVR